MVWLDLIDQVDSYFDTKILFPKAKEEAARGQSFASKNLPTAPIRTNENEAVPFVLGRTLCKSPTVIWSRSVYSQYRMVANNYAYYVGMALAICTGPDVKLKKIVIPNYVVWEDGVDSTNNILKSQLFGGPFQGGGLEGAFSFYSGETPQEPNERLESAFPGTPGYNGVAYIVFNNLYLGNSPNISSFSFEVERYTNGLRLSSGLNLIGADMNPAEILFQLLTSANWGAQQYREFLWAPSGASTGQVQSLASPVNAESLDLGSFILAAQTLSTEGLGLSLNIDTTVQAKDIVREVLRHIDGVLYLDPVTAKVALKLIRSDSDKDQAVVLNSENVINLRDYSHSSWSEAKNQLRVTFPNREIGYKVTTVSAQDMSSIYAKADLQSATMSFPYCSDETVASKIAARELAQISTPLTSYIIEVDRRTGSSLRPCDVVALSWSDYFIDTAYLRIMSVNQGTLEDGTITVHAIDARDVFESKVNIYREGPVETLHPPLAPLDVLFGVLPYDLSPQLSPEETDDFFFSGHAAPRSREQLGFEITLSNKRTGVSYTLTRPYTPHAVLDTEISVRSLNAEEIFESYGYILPIATALISDATTIAVKDAGFDLYSLHEYGEGGIMYMLGSTPQGEFGRGEFFHYKSIEHTAPGAATFHGVTPTLFDGSAAIHHVGATVYFLNAFSPTPAIRGSWADGDFTCSIRGISNAGRTGQLYNTEVPKRHRYQAPTPPVRAVLRHQYLKDDKSRMEERIFWRMRDSSLTRPKNYRGRLLPHDAPFQEGVTCEIYEGANGPNNLLASGLTTAYFSQVFTVSGKEVDTIYWIYSKRGELYSNPMQIRVTYKYT